MAFITYLFQELASKLPIYANSVNDLKMSLQVLNEHVTQFERVSQEIQQKINTLYG